MISNTLGGLSYGNLLANIASTFILGLGIIAALNRVEIATTVTLSVLITVLATVGGILVVGGGGGLIKPMQSWWEGYLDTMARETENVKQEAASAPSVKQHVQQAKTQAQAADARTRPTGGATTADVPFDRNQH